MSTLKDELFRNGLLGMRLGHLSAKPQRNERRRKPQPDFTKCPSVKLWEAAKKGGCVRVVQFQRFKKGGVLLEIHEGEEYALKRESNFGRTVTFESTEVGGFTIALNSYKPDDPLWNCFEVIPSPINLFPLSKQI